MKIGTIASHSALNIISGARAEGFETLLFCTPKRKDFYQSFGLGDSLVIVNTFDDILDLDLSDVVMIPHGSFVAYLGASRILKSNMRMFGNRELLRWEEDRQLKSRLMREAGLTIPPEFSTIDEADGPVIVKSYGAAGGKGYFIARDRQEFDAKVNRSERYSIQKYIVGTKVFVTYFNSLARKRLEVFGADVRYETDADANLRFDDEPSFVVIGNLPVVLRESTLADYYQMGLDFVKAFKRLTDQALPGPFCLETIIDREQRVYTFEFSGRIVAGTNVWIPSSPYSYLQFGEPVWMGRRIAIEIRELQKAGQLDEATL
ncbi:MAG: formate--phosphoribosylaminoimidazolecarboxamide ligase [Candidatus Thorarchaeota archaeon]|nr:formate--phosphoribosylaminoimidazolecarboxamide ligase [Candidatus Thorarchaeota archaeon]